MSTLEKKVKACVREYPHSTAVDILRFLSKQKVECTRKDVNSVLYKGESDKILVRTSDSPRRWRFAHVSLKAAVLALAKRNAQRAMSRADVTGKLIPVRHNGRSARTTRKAVRLEIPQLHGWQREALAAWHKNRRIGVVEAVTGTGKSMVGLLAAAEELRHGGKVLMVVPTIELQQQWCATIRERLAGDIVVGLRGGGRRDEFRDCDLVIAVVNAVRNMRRIKLPSGQGLLIADECHRYAAPANRQALNAVFPRRLGLTATLERDDLGHKRYLLPYFHKRVFQVDYRRAKRDDIIAPFRIGFVGVRFSPSEYTAFSKVDREARTLRSTLIKRYGLPAEPFTDFMRRATDLRNNEYATQEGRIAAKYLAAFAERQRLLAETKVKYAALRALTPAMQEADRSIVFTQTKESAARAARALRSTGLRVAVVHSDIPPRERHAALDAYKRGEHNVIVAPRVLDEGIDVPEADLGIIVAASQSKRQMIQRMGRVIRRKANGGRARFAVLYVEDTSEDPKRGAHESFLEELRAVAEDESVFRQVDEAALQFLRA